MTNADLIDAKDLIAEQLEDAEMRAEWERTAPARAVAMRLIAYRVDHKLSQTQLGRLLGMSQPAIARLETGEHTPTFETLLRIAEALDIEFLVDIKPSGKPTTWVSRRAEQATVIERITTSSGSELIIAAS